MKKILLILGIIFIVGFSLLVFFIFKAATVIHQATGQALYSSMGAWTRVQEYAHAGGKTNYIAYADQQLEEIQKMLDEFKKNESNLGISNFQKMEVSAYAQTDKNIKSGQNPLAFLDNTNLPPEVFSSPPTNESK
jgi:predicted SpoU family rRNA methylase